MSVPTQIGRILLSAAVGLTGAGCATMEVTGGAGPQVFVLHTPIQPTTTEPVVYTATASDPSGLTAIKLWEEQWRFVPCADDPARRCQEFVSSRLLHECFYSPPETGEKTCFPPSGPTYPHNHYVGYKAEATNAGGASGTDGWVFFTAGDIAARIVAGTYEWPDEPVSIYVRGDPLQKLDLVMIPDTDYTQNFTQFRDDVTALVHDAYFAKDPFAQEIRSQRAWWNFYLTYREGNAQGTATQCEDIVPPPNWPVLNATVNAGFVVHNEVFKDCSGIGEGSLFSAEAIRIAPASDKSYTVPVHESGHALFSLADEYSTGALFPALHPYDEHNVFRSKADCETNLSNHPNWPSGMRCSKISGTSYYRSDKMPDLMEDTASKSHPFGLSGQGRIRWLYDVGCPTYGC